MLQFSFRELELKEAYLIDCIHSADVRGRFSKSFEKTVFQSAGISFSLTESFISVSAKNTLRGLHFQLYHPQIKMVSVPCGRVYDVIVDLRKDSITYKQWVGIELSAENHRALFIPRGFAHGFIALEDNTVMLYQCDGEYDAGTDTGIRWDDPDLAIAWPIENKNDVICSVRDSQLMSFKEFDLKGFIYLEGESYDQNMQE